MLLEIRDRSLKASDAVLCMAEDGVAVVAEQRSNFPCGVTMVDIKRDVFVSNTFRFQSRSVPIANSAAVLLCNDHSIKVGCCQPVALQPLASFLHHELVAVLFLPFAHIG